MMTVMRESNSAMVPRSTPLYDMHLNPPYFVDYTSLCTGKRFHQSKRRVRFRFGFSDADALAAGGTGVECRGSEHEVTLVWSHTSGKICVLADGREVYFNVSKVTQGKFQYTWSMFGAGHIIKIIGHAAPPLKSKVNWKQFDLLLDGQSVFDMPKIYELGVKAGGGVSDAVVPFNEDRRSRYDDSVSQKPYTNYELSDEDMAWARRVEAHEIARGMDDESIPSAEVSKPSDQQSVHNKPKEADEPLRQQQAEYTSPFTQDFLSVPMPKTDKAEVHDYFSAPVAMIDQPPPIFNATPEASIHRDETPPSFLQGNYTPAPAPTFEEVTRSIMSTYTPSAMTVGSFPALPPSSSYFEMPPQTYLPSSQSASSFPSQAPAPAYGNTAPMLSGSTFNLNGVYGTQYASSPPAPAQYEQFNTLQQSYVSQYHAGGCSDPGNVVSADALRATHNTTPADIEAPPPMARGGSPSSFTLPKESILSEVDQAMKKLVNLGNIKEVCPPDYEDALFGTQQVSKKVARPSLLGAETFEERNARVPAYRKKQAEQRRSRGLPPAGGSSWTTHNMPLSEIQAASKSKQQPATNVMRTWSVSPPGPATLVTNSLQVHSLAPSA